MSDTMLALVMAECEHPVKQCAGDLKAKLRAAMNSAKDHWMVTDDDTQFRGSVGAVMKHYGKESNEWRALEDEINALRKVSAFLAAVQAGLTVNLPDLGVDEPKSESIGLIKMWREIKGSATG